MLGRFKPVVGGVATGDALFVGPCDADSTFTIHNVPEVATS